MKFMKLGSKPDVFQSGGGGVRYVASELPTDVTVDVCDTRFYLHKFPLLSRSGRLQKLILQASEARTDEIKVDDFPGGTKAFEICAKFCYGMTVTLNAYNVVAVRCAAEYLEMTEDIDRGNLIFKIDVFLSSSVFRSWKDSIIALQMTTCLLPWSEDLKIVESCIESIASKISFDPSDVYWSYTHNRKLDLSDQIVEQGAIKEPKMQSIVPKDWWIKDICELDVELYRKVMDAVKAKKRTPANVMGEALRAYAVRWIPNSTDMLVCDDQARRTRFLLETIVRLFPSDKTSSCCSFLLKLLKVAILIRSEDFLKEELLDRIGSQLEKASVRDLLIPASSPGGTAYDVHLVQSLVNRYMIQKGSSQTSDFVREGEKISVSLVLGHGSLIDVGKLIDGYLAEIASDPNLSLSSFVDLSRSLPEAARAIHDGLYAAIDIYLQKHVDDLSKAEKKRICALMDVRKLSADACLHAAQNERLPLRTIVQVLYLEQLRSTTAADLTVPSSGISHGSTWSTATGKYVGQSPGLEKSKSLKNPFDGNKSSNEELLSKENKSTKSCKNGSCHLLLPSRTRKIFDKLWIGKIQMENNKSSETSGSSAASINPGEAKSTGSSKNWRHSIS